MTDRFLELMAEPAVQEVAVDGGVLRRGSRVRIRARCGADLLDRALDGRLAVVEGIDEDDAGTVHVGVFLEGDPGWDLGETRHPAHRFFFAPSELEPLDEGAPARRKVLVAGIGNVFFGDDAFGVAVAQRLMGRSLPEGVEVGDFGIRGMDLAYALGAGYHAAVLIDALPRGGAPGTIHVVEPDGGEDPSPPDSHQMNPLAVLQLARRLGTLPPHLLIVGCEPDSVPSAEIPSWMELTPAVAAAVDVAAELVVQVAGRLAAGCTAAESLSAT